MPTPDSPGPEPSSTGNAGAGRRDRGGRARPRPGQRPSRTPLLSLCTADIAECHQVGMGDRMGPKGRSCPHELPYPHLSKTALWGQELARRRGQQWGLRSEEQLAYCQGCAGTLTYFSLEVLSVWRDHPISQQGIPRFRVAQGTMWPGGRGPGQAQPPAASVIRWALQEDRGQGAL